MCCGCWKEYGSPRIVNEKVLGAVKLVEAVYHNSLVGGHLHALLDDYNIEDEHLDLESDIAANRHGLPEDALDIERKCLAAFKSMTMEERASALGLHDGCFTMNNLTQPHAAKLGDDYDGCLLGATIGIGEMQYVYSIRKLILREQMDKPGKPVAEIREGLAKEITSIQQAHGILAPVFVNDELVHGPVEDKDTGPKILKPGDTEFRHYPNKN